MTELQNEVFSVENMKENDENVNSLQLTQHPDNDDGKRTQFCVEHTDPDTLCGIGKLRPQWLQKCATPRSYLIQYSLVGVIQGAYYSTMTATVTTLEKRYAFRSTISGSIMVFDEITPLFLGVLIGYFGGRMHKTRVLALGMYLTALCCFITALPYFIYGPAQNLVADTSKNETTTEFCERAEKEENCAEDDRPPTLIPVACLFMGSFLKGFGMITFYTMGVSYMDDVSKKKNTPLYFATAAAMRLFGPILGYVMTSAFLNYYENPFADPGYGNDDPRWVGAWWLGFFVQGIILSIITFPFLLFPRRLPTQRVRTLSNTANFSQETLRQKLMGMIKALKRLFTNPFYVIFVISAIFGDIGRAGIYSYLPKYLEVQFHFTASEASLFSGPPALIVSQCLIMLGGLVIWKFQPSVKTLLMSLAFVQYLWAVGTVILMFPSCLHHGMSGVTKREYGIDVQNECNFDCLCTTRAFSPVCGPDGISNYFSPCHAGCIAQEVSNGSIISNCSCLYNSAGYLMGTNTSVTSGLCKDEGCQHQAVIYNVLFAILAAVPNALFVAEVMILLRCVNPQDKSLSLGVLEANLSAFSAIPSPVFYGALADAACLIWEKNCGQTGNCWFYDVDKFNYLLHGCSTGIVLTGAIGYTVLCFMAHRVRDLYKDEDEVTCENSTVEEVKTLRLKNRILPTFYNCCKTQSN